MSVGDITQNSFTGMEKSGLLPTSPPAYSGPNTSNELQGNSRISVIGAAGIVTPDQVHELSPPPAYDAIFTRRTTEPPRPHKSNNYKEDDRNLWEKVHEWFELSILQLIIWLAWLAFSISFIVYGLMYDGQCNWKRYNKKGKVEQQEDLTGFMRVEGGVMCGTIVFVLLCRLLAVLDRYRTKRHSRSDLEGYKKCGGHLFFLGLGLYIANFGLCIAGASKIIPFYKDKGSNTTFKCDQEFYSFYYYAKIMELVILMPYALYVILALFFVPNLQKKWFLRHKWRQWVRLLDADQDGVISADDMEKTNAKLERIRILVGARNTALSGANQKKWWNDHIFKCGAGKDISIEDYISYLEGTVGAAPPHERANKVKPFITGFFNFFSTEDYRKKNLILGEEDFVKFWTILADVDERHCREKFVKHIPTPLTMAYFMEDFVAFTSHDEFWNEYGNRIFNVLKGERSDRCCKA
ncbi:uncharacterized protein LOC133203906 [Saccostrea echinata]|uniref:uncharacterized protein LOC133203906 n=1 Tax=Saccostrea echinata TaxID=191078 RepID=UPI002A816652|nr:uncharacterized protein LOC133203906 [Saccostrea echinata]